MVLPLKPDKDKKFFDSLIKYLSYYALDRELNTEQDKYSTVLGVSFV